MSEVATATLADVVSDIILFVSEYLLHSLAYFRPSYLPAQLYVLQLQWCWVWCHFVVSECLINSTVFYIFTDLILHIPLSLLAHIVSSSLSALVSNTWSQHIIADLYLVPLHLNSIPFQSSLFHHSIPPNQNTLCEQRYSRSQSTRIR